MTHSTLGGLVVTLSAVLLAACSSTPVDPNAGKPAGTSAAGATGAASTTGAAKPVAASTVATVSLPPHLDPKSAIATERSVFFNYDVFTIKSDYAALIERHGKYLASRPALSIRVEGNADERGSAEYNLALGQKRAQAVVQALKIVGAKDGQMEAVSWGEERPRSAGHDEAAWAENRRADLQYPKQ